MGAISEIEWEPCLLERSPNPEFEQRFQRETGRPGHFMQYFDGCPWLADTIVRLAVQHKTHLYIDPELADLIALIISQDNSCRFCFGEARVFLRVAGISEGRIARMEQDQLTGDFAPRDRAILDFARRLSRSRPLVTRADTEALVRAGLERGEILEIAGLAVSILFFNRLATLCALPPQDLEQFPDRLWVRLLRPLLAIRFRRMRHHAGAVALSPEQKSGPGAAMVNALDGLPIARELRIVLDGMWRDGPLPARTVSLLFAIVARALDSAHCEREARAMLEHEGMPATDIEQVLDHLAAPVLSSSEALLIPLARETVWYQPAQLQRRCIEVQKQVGKDEFLHFIGVVSLVNAFCRIAFVIDLD